MDKSAASRKAWRSYAKRQSQETPVVAAETLPILGVSEGLCIGNVRKALSGVSLENSSKEEMGSTSSSSLALSSGEENKMGKEIRKRSPRSSNRPGREELNRCVERLAAEANWKIQENERRRREKAVATSEEVGTQHEAAHRGTNIHYLIETDVDEEVAPPGWGDLIEQAVDTLIEVSATQHELAEGHKRQMTKEEWRASALSPHLIRTEKKTQTYRHYRPTIFSSKRPLCGKESKALWIPWGPEKRLDQLAQVNLVLILVQSLIYV